MHVRGKRWLYADAPLRHFGRGSTSLSAGGVCQCVHPSRSATVRGTSVPRAVGPVWAARTFVMGVPCALRATRACVCPGPTREQAAHASESVHRRAGPGFVPYQRQALLSSPPRPPLRGEPERRPPPGQLGAPEARAHATAAQPVPRCTMPALVTVFCWRHAPAPPPCHRVVIVFHAH